MTHEPKPFQIPNYFKFYNPIDSECIWSKALGYIAFTIIILDKHRKFQFDKCTQTLGYRASPYIVHQRFIAPANFIISEKSAP